ncbi:MAG: serine hydrolase domain-containing protein [Bacteroidota bacterium]
MNSPTNQLLASILLLLPLISCNQEKGEPLTMTEQLDTLFQQYVDTSGFSGNILIADSSGIMYTKTVGYQHAAEEIPMQPNTAFYLASLSKHIHAMGILYLADQGKLSLEGELVQYLPEMPAAERITIRQLLTHTHGIPDYYNFMKSFPPGLTNADVLKEIQEVDSLLFEPGTQFSYGNSGYTLLTTIAAQVSGKRYADFMQETFFGPIGMNHTVIFDELADSIPNRAVAVNTQGEADNYQFRTVGGGGIFSTAKDLYKWDRALYSSQYIRPEMLQAAYSPVQIGNGSTHPYGFGWFTDDKNPSFVYHTGELNGFRNYIGRWLDEQKLIIMLSNNQREASPELIEAIYGVL